MKQFFQKLKVHIEQHPPNCGDGDSILEMLYECHNENNPYDNEQIKGSFDALYQAMNGMTLQDMDRIVYPLCTLCREHEKSGFVEGVKVGMLLAKELGAP